MDEESRLILLIASLKVNIIESLENMQKLQENALEQELQDKITELTREKDDHLKTKKIMEKLQEGLKKAKSDSIQQIEGSKQVKDEVEKLHVSRNSIRDEMMQLQMIKNG